ncbi:hypothetical protein BV25DRAFT_1921827 [Artomyces pyxidatus]|uniref:Uncharacterized protein n=1 Tax=Artomyces pyxidatus TaxID=48021 RepID=A0ACB8SHA5_9AGAM|nr:hypothetical protein BV25DRAFT_1921827 [Artomyces pyxidatus]
MPTLQLDSNAAPSIIVIPDPNTEIGPMFVGNILSWMLMGTLIVQFYMYCRFSKKDRIAIRLLVYCVFCLDIAQTVFGTHQSWFFMVANWNNPAALAAVTWSVVTIPITSGCIAGMVQAFYAWRIWMLKSTIITRVLTLAIIATSILQFLAAIISSALLQSNPIQENLIRLRPGFVVWLSGSFAADILVTGCMCSILYEAKTRISRPNAMLDRLIANTIQTGMITVICAGVELALFITLTSRNYYLAPAYILGKLYSNSLLATLNARPTMQAASPDPARSSSLQFRGHIPKPPGSSQMREEVELSRFDGAFQKDDPEAWLPTGESEFHGSIPEDFPKAKYPPSEHSTEAF